MRHQSHQMPMVNFCLNYNGRKALCLTVFFFAVETTGPFHYFVIIETVIAITFYMFNVAKIAWHPSQQSLAQCWNQLIEKVQEFQNQHNRGIDSKRIFGIFWLWLLVLSLAYCIMLTVVVLQSPVKFIVQANHFIFYALRIYAYLCETTISASFALFAMLLRNLIIEMQATLQQTTVRATHLRSTILLYRHILRIVECFCSVYGWIILLIFFEHFLILTDRSFFSIRLYRISPNFSARNILYMLVTWVLPLAFNDLLLIGACTVTEEALHQFEKQVCAINLTDNSDSDIVLMVTSFSLYSTDRKSMFRILNALNLNFNLIYACCGVLATYLTIFLQFDHVEA
ncbi:uncharacterized protein LOC128722527 [Anopheles nili]|uniref:uncharacterized protein LOC128722527 n=1 Tax=Anopheles nili TaxID=185578 RepID=UPI00237B7640|nr:uncharacterized protein LOC128722527 [Anopheles nili]